MTEITQPKVKRDHEPTILEQAHLEVRESEQGPSAPRTAQSSSEPSTQRSPPGRKPLFRR